MQGLVSQHQRRMFSQQMTLCFGYRIELEYILPD